MRFAAVVPSLLALAACTSPLVEVRAQRDVPETALCLIDAVNAERRAVELPELTTSDQLSAAAMRHSNEMATRNKLYHSDRAKLYGSSWAATGENVAENASKSCQVIARRLKESSAHHVNTVDPKWTHVGAGAVETEDRAWVTIAFAKAESVTTTSIATTTTTAPKRTTTTCTCP